MRMLTVLSMLLLAACSSAPPAATGSPDGVYELSLTRDGSVQKASFSFGWTASGYEGYLTSQFRSMELVDAEVDGSRLRLEFASSGASLYLALSKDGELLKGTWREMGRGGSVQGRRVSTAWNRDSERRRGSGVGSN